MEKTKIPPKQSWANEWVMPRPKPANPNPNKKEAK
jgi:hypothetical protein